jgi:hypothetical protein
VSPIAGGAVETLPAIEDQRAPQLKPYFDRHYAGASEYAGWWDVEIIHGSGSPAAEWLQMYREFDLDGAAKHVDGMVMGR